jgi:capsular polysaccharide export protein
VFSRRARDSFWHYYHVAAGRVFLQFPFYQSHRRSWVFGEFVGWLIRAARLKRRARQARETLAALPGQRYFLVPMQLSGDYQIRAHSAFLSMAMGLDYIFASFAKHAPADAKLLVKEHPLDISYGSWRRHIRRRARHYGVGDRVMHIDGGDLAELCQASAGMVCINSTSGTLALSAGTPVIVLGDAVYDVPGITHQGLLDGYWAKPEAPDAAVYEAFKKVLHAECLVRGGLASESATRILIENSVERLLAPPLTPVAG